MAVARASGHDRIRLARRRRRWGEDAIKGVLALFALVSLATTIGIVVALLVPAVDFFRGVGFVEFFTETRWAPLFQPPNFGVVPLVVGTVSVTIWACVIAMPFGLGAAIFMSEYARSRVRNVLKPSLEVLAGIPTVVYGYFALTFFTPLLRDLGLPVEIFNPLSAGIVIGIMLIPTVASLSEDAMTAVPQSLRDGAYALGANKLDVSLRIVVPAAISGIIASYVLAISRAVGETMIVLLAAGQLARIEFNPLVAIETMTAFIAATGTGDVPTGSIEYKTIFAVGITLFTATFLMNLVSIRLVARYREVYE